MEKKESKNRQILEAALFEFMKHGVDGASMEAISKRAEVSKRTLYKYYSTKYVLYGSLIQSLFEGISETLKFPFSEDRSLEDMLKDVFEIKSSLLLDNNFINVAKLVLIEQLKNTQMDPEVKEKLFESRKYFEDWVKKCQESGKMSSSYTVLEISEYFHAVIDSYIMWPVLIGEKPCPDKEELERIKKTFTKAFLSMFTEK